MANWIDAHHHLWEVKRGDYGWLTPDVGVIYRDFTVKDLQGVIQNTPVKKTILVQAASTVAETEYLLDIAKGNDTVAGVIGWVDFDKPQQAVKDIERLSQNPYFKGIRPMLQDIDNRDYILNPDFDDIFKALIDHNLRFEALVFPDGLPAIEKIVTKYPDLQCIIDHCAKPQIRNGVDGKYGLYEWQNLMAPFTNISHVHVKISGILTESNPNAGVGDVSPYVNWLLDNFSHSRLIWGSDWPVLNLANDYQGWVAITQQLFHHLPRDTQQKITKDNAVNFYNL